MASIEEEQSNKAKHQESLRKSISEGEAFKARVQELKDEVCKLEIAIEEMELDKDLLKENIEELQEQLQNNEVDEQVFEE